MALTVKLNNSIIIYDEISRTYCECQIGELLFSFFDIDFKEYKELYDKIKDINSVRSDVLKELEHLYPKTTMFLQNFLPKALKGMETEAVTDGDIAVQYLLHNKDKDFSFLDNYDLITLTDLGLKIEINQIYFSPISYDQWDDLDFYSLQLYFKDLLNFCFIENDSKISFLTPKERYYIYSIANPSERYQYRNKEVYWFMPSPLSKELEDTFEDIHYDYKTFRMGSSILTHLNNDLCKRIHESIKGLVKATECDKTVDFLTFDFSSLLSMNMPVKICENCGKYFVASGKYNTNCCDRIPPGQKHSCKKIMAQKRRKEKLNTDPIAKEYEKAYKRMYARVKNSNMTQEEFLKWNEEATIQRNIVSKKYAEAKTEDILIDFKKFLGNK